MIDLDLWRARIGLYVHKYRRSARVRIKIVLARETRSFFKQKNGREPSMNEPPNVSFVESANINHGTIYFGPPEAEKAGKNSISSFEIENAEQQGTREQTARDTLSKPNFLDTTMIINLMRMLPLLIILLLLVCGDVELNPGPTLGEFNMITESYIQKQLIAAVGIFGAILKFTIASYWGEPHTCQMASPAIYVYYIIIMLG